MNSIARLIACALVLAGVLLSCGVLHAQSYPNKTVRVIVPQAAGGATDIIARIVAQRLTENLGQQFIVDNRAGAGGNIGTRLAAKAAPDGHTLLITGNNYVINPTLYKEPGYDPVKDFAPVTPVATTAYVLIAPPSLPANSVKELIALAKSKPGELMYASAGNGTLNHLLGEMFKTAAGVDIVHVPYKGAAASITDVVSGQMPLSFQSLPSAISFVRAGRVKVLGVATEKRVPVLADVPTIGETVTGYGPISWYGLVVPARTPKAVIAKLHAETLRALDNSNTREKLSAQGAEAFTSTPEKFAAMLKVELNKWAGIVQASGARID